jgi:hypothetical protein
MSRQTKFNIIRQWNSPNEVTTIWGWKAFREEKLFAPDPYNTFFPCLNYDNHFIYEIPDWRVAQDPKAYGGQITAFMCTCGAPAVLIGVDAYRNDANPEGLVFGCMFRNNRVDPETGELTGRHADGST